MPDLLLELRSEEIPAGMQRKAAGDLRKLVTDGLVEAGLTYEAAREYWTPRRLTLDVRGLTARSKDVREERKGPGITAPDAAIQGFLRGAGLTSVDQAHVHSDPRKGEFYVAHILKPGRPADEIIAGLMPAIIRGFPWPKTMRWGAASGPKGARYGTAEGLGGDTLRWIRPLQSIVCTFGPETGEPVVVDFEVGGIRAGNVTYGHRFHAPDAITVRRFDDYAARLEAARVVLDADRRKEIILSDARNLAFANGLDLVEDDGLLEEVAGLVEWPVVLLGAFEADYLAIPPEVIRLTIRANQKCFVTRPAGGATPISPRVGEMSPEVTEGGAVPPTFQILGNDAGDGSSTSPPSALPGISPTRGEIGQSPLSNRFILTANIEAADGGAEIVHGNGKVVRARLSDALYFWKTDQADLPDLDRLAASAQTFGLDLTKPLDQRMARLDHLGVTFHARLGTQGQRVERIARLAGELAPVVGAEPGLARRAAVLAKADLQTEIVGEFPELQGAMGRKYAELQGEHPSVAAAIEDHWKPQGPSDRVPADPVAVAVALADKLDTLVGFWAIGEKPTGSKDPYALRRAALGVIRIVVENGVRLELRRLAEIMSHHWAPRLQMIQTEDTENDYVDFRGKDGLVTITKSVSVPSFDWRRLPTDLLSFFHDRLKVYLRDQGARHDLIDAVLAAGSRPISPRVGGEERSTEGREKANDLAFSATNAQSVSEGQSTKPKEGGQSGNPPPSALPGISPSRGEIDQANASLAPSLQGEDKGEGDSHANDDLLAIIRRVEALGAFLATDDGQNLLAGTKRAANILAAEEKKKTRVAETVDPGLFSLPAEEALFTAVNQAERDASQAIAGEDFSAAMRALSLVRAPVDAFFEQVLVNDEDDAVRANRLALLARIRAATGQVADFSRIAG